MEQSPLDSVHIDELLERTLEAGCRELHLRGDMSPYAGSCNGYPQDTLSRYGVASPLQIQQIIYAILSDEQIIQLEPIGALIFPYSLMRKTRFDVHVFHSKTTTEADFHVVPHDSTRDENI